MKKHKFKNSLKKQKEFSGKANINKHKEFCISEDVLKALIKAQQSNKIKITEEILKQICIEHLSEKIGNITLPSKEVQENKTSGSQKIFVFSNDYTDHSETLYNIQHTPIEAQLLGSTLPPPPTENHQIDQG